MILGVVATASLPQASAAATLPVVLSGAYAGPANVRGLTEFGNWRGAPTTVALDYLSDSEWNDIDQPSWTLNAWRRYQKKGGNLVLSVPMLTSAPGGTFTAGAAGTFDRYFTTLGRKMVADGYSGAVLRIGWEFNGNWFPWSLSRSNATDGPKAFIADWRHLVDLFRSIPGSHFRFDWTVNPGPSASGVPAADAYPGDQYVDYVGVDQYDSSWNWRGGRILGATARWRKIANQRYGLNWWLRFAKAHDKQITVPEWGLNNNTSPGSNGAGDDPSFIAHMYNWFKLNEPAYQMYFDYGGSALDTGADPRSSLLYRKLFGDGLS